MKILFLILCTFLPYTSLAQEHVKTLLAEGTEEVQACDQICGDYYSWAEDKLCYRYAGSGRQKYLVKDSFCGDDYYSWADDKLCYRYAGSGRQKYLVKDSYCGSDYYQWGENGYCYRYAESGREKYLVKDSYCGTCR